MSINTAMLAQETPESMSCYLKMKTSLDQFGKIASDLDEDQSKQLNQIMTQALKIYNAVLSSDEAKKVIVPDAQVNMAMKELKGRFSKTEDFNTVLEANDLDEYSLKSALRNELHCETTLDYVSNDCNPLTDAQAQDYYYQNMGKFTQPERRKASHILITLNDEFEENTVGNAHKRMADIANNITTGNFSWHAIRHSECPTAVEEGNLGLIEKGKLHKELDEYLFKMKSNTISEVIETEIGLHIMWCVSISEAHIVNYINAKEQIIEQHLALAKKRKQKTWIASLFNVS